ncbi:D-amino acid dehydrogenase [Microvirga arabica]|uniref:D-amino acid dehydrogenase n=1 Tax=Microvirga arabica TaxID=1128671 RepID=A0ABV6YDY2_9HYPH|nr:D-amino acid dehydrogenase [Microvirga arabica]MBM1174536.1 D-amino acid dehydrogenase [Microvirga arabica]
MKIIVIGAGIIGLTTAYYLARDGHSVTVVDSGEGAGLRTSKANGAQLSYSFVSPLADPGVLPKLPSWLLDRNSPLSFQLKADPDQWRWLFAFLKACRASKAQRTTAELAQLGMYSRELVHELVRQERPSFGFESSGKLLVYQDAKTFAAAQAGMDFQASLGCRQTLLTPNECLIREPALEAIRGTIIGGIFTPTEDAGDCFQLCAELERIMSSGATPVSFRYRTTVEKLRVEGSRIVGLQTSQGDMAADDYVIANGVGAQGLAKQVGIDPYVYPLKGYSLTYELGPDSLAPTTSVSDLRNKVVYARLGTRLRVAGMVDIGDTTASIAPHRIASLRQNVQTFLPSLNAVGEPKAWAGLRPARPDGKPIIGQTHFPNLWLNVGHGALGFTLAAGSAGLLADQIAERPTSIPAAIFGLPRSRSLSSAGETRTSARRSAA